MAFIQNMLRSLKMRSLIKIIVDETINNYSPLMHKVSRHVDRGGGCIGVHYIGRLIQAVLY